MDFTTPNTVMNFLNKTAFTPQESVIVGMLIKQISGVIRNYCGWEVLATTYTNRLFDGSGTTTLDLKAFPVNSVERLTIAGVDYTDSVLINAEHGELYFDTSAGVSFTRGTKNVVITYNAGHPTVPDELDFVAAWLVAVFYSRIDLENIGVAEERFNDTQVKYDPTELPILVKKTLDKYRRIGIY